MWPLYRLLDWEKEQESGTTAEKTATEKINKWTVKDLCSQTVLHYRFNRRRVVGACVNHLSACVSERKRRQVKAAQRDEDTRWCGQRASQDISVPVNHSRDIYYFNGRLKASGSLGSLQQNETLALQIPGEKKALKMSEKTHPRRGKAIFMTSSNNCTAWASHAKHGKEHLKKNSF